MGVDQALLESARAEGVATLRLYAWRGPWLSLGHRQRLDAERASACAAAGVGIVRRVTGGGAVLHGGDLSYALAAPASLLPDGLAASYALVARALDDALAALGVRADPPSPPEAGAQRAFDCFAAAGADALCAQGRKLAGSAQRRVRGAVLQHGSLRVAPDPPRARVAAGITGEAATSLRELGCRARAEAIVAACVTCLGAALDARFHPATLCARELRDAARRAGGDPVVSVPLSAESQEPRPPTR